MVFSSIAFIYMFLPIALILYYSVPGITLKNYCLLFLSLIFYAWGEPVYIFLMILCSLINYVTGIIMVRFPVNYRKWILAADIVLNIAMLGVFKYSNFIVEILNAILRLNIKSPDIRLPIGISFFTFQALSYVIDLYRGEVELERNFPYFMTYVSMFPQLIAGPIVRFKTISNEIRHRNINLENFSSGLIRFLEGLFKKVLIANQLGELWKVYDKLPIDEISTLGGLLGLLAFLLELYFDFSGYSDMAIGLGKMLGFNYLENFNYPLSSVSVNDFWRRWHISMSSWFRDYLYIPLGGNRCSNIAHIRNILVVWAITGLWHGASFNFILWGLYYAFFLLLEKYIIGKYIDNVSRITAYIYTMFINIIGFGFFAMTSLQRGFMYMGRVFDLSSTQFIDGRFLYYLNDYKIILFLAIIFSFPMYPRIKKHILGIEDTKFKNAILILGIIMYVFLFMISTAYLVADTYNPFLYFRF